MPARVAVLYDIHGNLPALDAVLHEICEADFDIVVVGGDVLPGPMPLVCLQRLQALALPTHYLCGNGERETMAAADGAELASLPEAAKAVLRWTAVRLGQPGRDQVAAWPDSVRLTVEGIGPVLFCHATPRSHSETVAADASRERLAEAFSGSGAALVVCGHTHRQFDRTTAGARIINAGSVGMPFEAPGAYWLELGAAGPRPRRTVYDIAAAAAAIAATGFPFPDWFGGR
ncbi:MAG: metallophosphoesterase family protein [Terriglobales bacterium]